MATQGCKCGFLGSPRRSCRCSPAEIAQHRGRLSGPLLDRIDVSLDVGHVPARDLARARQRPLLKRDTDPSRARVLEARARQATRAVRLDVARINARLTPADLERAAPLSPSLRSLLGDATVKLGLSARGYHRVWRLARTIADLGGRAAVEREAIAEALMLRAVETTCI